MINIKDKWSVWWAYVAFTDYDDKGKGRPVIIYDDRIVICASIGVTRTEKDSFNGYEIKRWKYAGLREPSWVRFEYLELEPDDFGRKLGMLHIDDIEGVQKWLEERSHGHSKYRPD